MLLVGLAFVVSDTRFAGAQTPTLVDYDTDDDGLIEVTNRNQLQAVHWDLNADGVAESRASWPVTPTSYAASYPNPMTGMGCKLTDHDSDPSTPMEPTCIGYELANDINAGGNQWVGFGKRDRSGGATAHPSTNWAFTGMLVGNGFQVNGPYINSGAGGSHNAFIGGIGPTGSVEGLGLDNARFNASTSSGGAVLVSELRGKVMGVYLHGGEARNTVQGTLAKSIMAGSDHAGLLAHSYANGTDINSANFAGGLVYEINGASNGNSPRCLNSYYSGKVDSGQVRGLLARSVAASATVDNCYTHGRSGSTTTDAWNGASSAQNAAHIRTEANLRQTDGYVGDFAQWDDYSADGLLLADNAPRTNFWEFGGASSYPTLRGWGHDRTLTPARSSTTTDSVDLCTRTPAVAAEILRLAQDSNFRAGSGVSAVPAAVSGLTGCTGTNTQMITLAQLRDLVVTSPTNTFNLGPDRTVPPAAPLTRLDADDFAYLVSASHFDLGNNSLEEVPPRLFHGVPLRYLDLSNNNLTMLPADLFAGIASVTAVGGNALLLNGNSLTDTGIPGRIFDGMAHLNGLDLSDNSLTRVNTRWFQQLNNLGRKAATSPPYTHALGLHLAGNTIDDHYYSHKIFSGVTSNVVTYADTTGPAVSAGDALRTAIINAIDAATVSHANLSLSATSYYSVSGGSNSGYAATSCASTQRTAPGRFEFLNGELPACMVQVHWTPPHKSGDTAATAPSITGQTGARASIGVNFTHTTSTSFVGYQVRWRGSSNDAWTSWQIVPFMISGGSNSFTIVTPHSGTSHNIEMRTLSSTGPPSTATAVSTSTSTVTGPTGFTVQDGNVGVGTIRLSWTAIVTTGLATNHSLVAQFYRYKPDGQSTYTGGWHELPTSATSATISGLTPGVTYDVQLAGGIDSGDDGSLTDYLTDKASGSATALLVPANLTATGGTNPGSINVRWNQQTLSQVATAKFQVRRKRRTEDWDGVTWADVPDDSRITDSGAHTYDETGVTLTGLLGGELYDIQVRFVWSATVGAQTPISVSARPTRAAAPTSLLATASTAAVTLNWNLQNAVTSGTEAGYQVRYKRSTEDWPVTANMGWEEVSGSTYATVTTTVAPLEGVLHNFQVRFRYSNAIGYSAPASVDATPGAVPAPQNFGATQGTNPGDVNLTWRRQTATSDADVYYQLRYKPQTASWPAASPFGWAQIAGSGPNTQNHMLTGLRNNTPYDFELRFFQNAPSAARTSTATTRAVIRPTGFNIQNAAGEIVLRWNGQSATTNAQAGYEARWKKTSDSWPTQGQMGWTNLAGTDHSSTRAGLTGLEVGSAYHVQLRFRWSNSVGVSPATSTLTSGAFTGISPPTGVSAATGTLIRQIAVNWNAQTQTTSPNAKFQLRGRLSPSGTWSGWSDVPDSASDADSHTHNETGGTWSTSLRFRQYDVQARFAVGSTYSTAVQVNAVRAGFYPRNLQAVPGTVPGTIEVTWDAQTAHTANHNRVALQAIPTGTLSMTTGWPCCLDPGQGSHATTSLTLSGSLGTTTFTAGSSYDVRANFSWNGIHDWVDWNNPNNEMPSVLNVMAATVLAPENLAAVASTTATKAVLLTWDEQTASTDTASHFEYRYRTSARPSATPPVAAGSWGTWTNVLDDSNGTDAGTHTYDETGVTITGLAANTGYDFEVRFHWNATHGNTPTTNIPDTTGTSSTVITPTNVGASAGTGAGDIVITWDLVNDADSYDYFCNLAGTGAPQSTDWLDVTDQDSDSMVDDEDEVTASGLTGGSEYDCYVRAQITGHSSLASDSASATAPREAAPTSFMASTGSNPGTIDLSWVAPTSGNLGGTLQGFEFRYRRASLPDVPTNYTQWADVPDNPDQTADPDTDRSDETAYTITSLWAGVSYVVQIRTESSIGYSGVGMATTATATSGSVSAPAGFSASIGDMPGEIDLTWTQITSGLPGSDTVVNYQFRTKLNSGSTWGDWTDMPTANTASYTIPASHNLTAGTQYDIELRAAIADNDEGTATTAEYHSSSDSETGIYAGIAIPDGLSATTPSTGAPGRLTVSWNAQTTFGATFTSAKYEYRYKETATANWPNTSPFGWQDVPSSDRSTDTFTISGIKGGTQFDVQVRFVPNSTIGAGAAASDDGTSSAVAAITGFTATDPGGAGGRITISWNGQSAVTDSTAQFEYRVKAASATDPVSWPWRAVPDNTDQTADPDSDRHDETTYTITELSAGTRLSSGANYHIQLRFFMSTAVGSSATVTTTQTASVVPVPTGFSASAGTASGSIDLGWTASAGATGYQYRCNPAGTSCTTTPASAGTGTSHTITGLTTSETYNIQIRAQTTNVGDSAWTAVQTSDPQAEAAPTSFSASTGSNPGEIDLSWTAPTSGNLGGTLVGFEFRYRRASQPDVEANYTQWAPVPDSDTTPPLDGRANETAYTITSLWGGTSYVVQIRTESSIGRSNVGMSTTATATSGAVSAPASFSGSVGANPGTINLTWTHITSGLPGSDSVVNYQFRTKLSSSSTWGNWTNMPTANTSSYTIPASHNLTAGTQYDVDLRAAIADSDEGTATTAEYESAAASVTSIYSGIASPASPRAITPTSGNPGRITISWTAQTTFSTGSYQYRYRTSPNAYPGTWTNVPSSSSTTNTFTISDLINGRSYDVQVRFLAGTAGTSAPSTATGNTRAIAIPSGLTAEPAAATVAAIDLAWSPQSAVTVGTAKFQYRFKRDNVAWGSQTWNDIGDSAADSDSDAHNERAYTITSGLTAGARYDIQLRLFMSTAIGASQPREATANASNVPVPQNFSASTGFDAGEIRITWSTVNGATGYEYRCEPAGTGCTNAWQSAGTGTSHTIANLSNGVWYNLQLRATAPNNSASAATSTQRARAQTTPGPASFTLSAGTNPGEIVLTWTPPSRASAPVTHYEYRYKLSRDGDSAYPDTYTRSPDSDSDGDYDDERTATLTGLTSGAEYDVQIRVFASSSIGYSLPLIRSRKPTPVPPPTNFREDTMATLDPGEVKLNWDAPTGVNVLRYELRHQLGTTGRWSNWESVGTATTHTFTGLRAGQLRTFQIRTVMTTVGNSDAVSTTGTPTPVPIPMNFTASTGTYPGEIDISWTAVTGATSYEYRVRLSTVTGAWPDDAWVSVAATPTETVITGLSQDSTMAVPINYSVQLRAVIRNVGESDPDDATAAPRSKTITDAADAESLGSEYKIIEDVPEFLIIEIPPARVADTFIYRYREANPGLWSRWFKVTPMTRTEPTRHWIRGLTPNTVYEVEIRAYRIPPQGMTEAFTAARSQTRTPVQLDPPEGFEADESSGVILLTWASPARYIPIRYEYSYRKAGETEWSDWIDAPHVGDVGADQSRWVSDLDRGFRYDFRLRTVTVAGATEPSGTYGTARVNVAEVVRIQPTVRSVNVRAGDQIALTVDIYDTQDGLANGILGREGSRLFICWEQTDPEDVEEPDDEAEACVPGGSMFGTPNNGRRVTYTVPDTPGVYTVTAEPQPDGICTSHHAGADEITRAERDACTATFTIRVSAAPTITAPRPDPQDPRNIPTSLTDDDGQRYAIFTPAAGGTYTNEQITVTAPAGAVADRTVLGIASTVSEITPPAPIPGTTLTVAGSYHEVTAITGDAEPPVPSYTLSAPVTACLPFPTEFRADLSNVVVVQRKPDGNLTLLSSKVRLTNGEFQVCGTLSTLPATLGVARVGTVPQPAPDRESGTTPGIEPPDTGAWTPGPAAWAIALAAAAVMFILGAILMTARLTGLHRISRM